MTVMSFPMPETRLPGLPALLDGSLWRRWSERGAVFPLKEFREAVRYVRLKPRTSCRLVVFDPAPDDGRPPAYLLHLYAGSERAVQAFQKLDGDGSFLDERAAAVVAPFWLDPELPALRHFHRPHRLRAALEELLIDRQRNSWRVRKHKTRAELLAFKPGRRAVFRAEVKLKRDDRAERLTLPLHLQVEHPETIEQSHRNLCLVHEALCSNADWSVPEPIGLVGSRGLVASVWESGTPVTGILGSAFETATLRETAAALAGLHRLDIPSRALGPARRSLDLRALAADLGDLLPDERSLIIELAERLTTLAARFSASDAVVPSHGDFHPGQVLLHLGRVLLIDFDRAGFDHAAADVGEFLARLVETGREGRPLHGFVDAYRDAAPYAIGDAEIQTALAIALFRRASVPFRELASDWPDRMRQRLSRSAEAAERAR
jgi:thiamine kinase-like enzyme